MIFRVTLALDLDADNEAEAIEAAGRLSVVRDGKPVEAELVSIEDSDWNEIS